MTVEKNITLITTEDVLYQALQKEIITIEEVEMEIIRTIRPRMLIQVHTENPEFFIEHFSGAMLVKPPVQGEAIPIE